MQKLTISVTVCHLLFVFLLCYTVEPPILDVPKKFAVKTISLKAENVQNTTPVEVESLNPTPVPVEPTPTQEPVKIEPTPAKPVEKKKVDKPAPPKKQEVAKKPPAPTPAKKKETPSPVKKNDAFSQARKALSDIKPTSSEGVSKKGKIGDLHIEGIEGDSYFSELIAKMQKTMKFPESGEVIVELNLERSGKVLNIAIKDAKSMANKLYVEKTLPSIKFPVFEGSLKHENAHTFIVVLNSVSLD